MRLRLFGICIALVVSVALTLAEDQDEPAPVPAPALGRVTITVQQVRVSDNKARLDRRLKKLAQELKRARIKFGSLQLLSQSRVSATLKKEKQVNLSSNLVLKLTMLALSDTQLTLKTVICKRELIKDARGKTKEKLIPCHTSSWRIKRGQYVFLGGFPIQKDRLLIVITADWAQAKTPPKEPESR